VTLITHAFEALAKSEREAFGAPDHPVLIVQHPIGTVKLEEVNKRADAAFDKLVEMLVEPQLQKVAAAS
jgi:hypothetical protein